MKMRNIFTLAATMVVASYAGQTLAQEGPGIDAPPPAPLLLAPAGGTEINGLNDAFPKFTWTAVSTATSYQLYVAQVGVGGTVVKTATVGALTNCTDPVSGVCSANDPNLFGLMPDGASYRWWVGSQNAFSGGNYTWSTPSTFSYALTALPPAPVTAADLLNPAGNAPAPTRTTFEWTNTSTASFFRVLVYIQESGFLAGPGKWVSDTDAGCTLPGGTGSAACSTTYAGHVGKSPFEDYCFTITPWNSKGIGMESPQQCFQNTTQ